MDACYRLLAFRAGGTFFYGRREVWPMHPAAIAGTVLTLAGAAGYAAGVVVPYPGRAFSITAVMVGLTVLSVGRVSREEEA